MSTLQTTAEGTPYVATPDAAPSRHRWPLDGRSVAWLVVAYAALVGVGALVGTVLTRWAATGPVGRFDTSVSRVFADARTPRLNTLTDIGSGLSDTLTVVVALGVLAVVFVATWRRWDEITLLATALALEVTSFVSIAYVVGRDRPPVEQLDPSPPTSGFPSGHTAAAVALYFGLVLIVAWRSGERRWVGLAATAAALAVSAVALSRMYRGMHFFTDVAAGALLGAACLAVAWKVMHTARARNSTDEVELITVKEATP